ESLVIARVEVDDVEGWADARHGRVDDATTGGPLWRRAVTECVVAFGSTIASSWSSRRSARSSWKYDVSAPFTRTIRDTFVRGTVPLVRGTVPRNRSATTSRARSYLPRRDRVLEVGDHRVRARLEGLQQLPLVAAGGKEKRP